MTAKTLKPAAPGKVPAKLLRARVSEAYARQGRQAAEEQWILQYLPLVRHIVRKIADSIHAREDYDDLASAGTVGLVKAARSFDPRRNVTFKTYAYIRIRGAVIDELRNRSFTPAAMFTVLRRIEAAHQRLAGETGHTPSDAQLAEETGLSLAKLYRTFEEARRAHFLSIHGMSTEDCPMQSLVPPDRAPGPDAAAERKELSQLLAEAIKELSDRDRKILVLYYDRDLTMKEVAQVLEITESRVSQLHASALFKLSMKLKGLS